MIPQPDSNAPAVREIIPEQFQDNSGNPTDTQCSATNLQQCVSETTCGSAGGFWYNNQCNASQQGTDPVCDSAHLNLCVAETTCLNSGGYWYNNQCNSTAPAPVCDATHLNLCLTEISCANAGGYWNNNSCSATPPVVVTNYALTASASASSYYRDYQSAYPVTNLKDGNDSSRWISNFLYNGFYQEEWVQLDLGQSRSISEISISWSDAYFPQNYSLWIWNGYTWIMIKDLLQSSGGTSQISLNGIQGRYWMLRMRGGYRYVGITELQMR